MPTSGDLMPESPPVMFGIFPPEVIEQFAIKFGHEFDPFTMTRTEAEWLGDALDTAMHPRRKARR